MTQFTNDVVIVADYLELLRRVGLSVPEEVGKSMRRLTTAGEALLAGARIEADDERG